MEIVRQTTLKELVAIRHIEKDIPWILEGDSKFDASQSVKRVAVYSLQNVSNFVAYSHRRNKNYVYRIAFIHEGEEYNFRVSKGFFHHTYGVGNNVTIEFTKYLGYEVLLSVKGVVDYVEIYKYLHLQKNNIDKGLRATGRRKAINNEKKEFNFQILDAISTVTFFMIFPMLLADSFLNPVFGLWALVPIPLWIWFYFSIRKRRKYQKKAKVYSFAGLLSFNETRAVYTLNDTPLTLSKSWESFFKKYVKKERGYNVKLEGFAHHSEESILSFQPISLKIGEYSVDYKMLKSFKHPFTTMFIATTLYFSLFTFDYQKFIITNWNRIQMLTEQEQVFDKNNSFFEASLIPHQEVTFKAYPVPIINKEELFRTQGYRLIDERSNIEAIYPKVEDKLLSSFGRFNEIFIQKVKGFASFDKIVFKFNESPNEFNAITLENRNDTKDLLVFLKSSEFKHFQNYVEFVTMLEERLAILEKLVIEQDSKRDAYSYIGTLRIKVHKLDKKLYVVYKNMRAEYLPFLKKGVESYVGKLELFALGEHREEALMKVPSIKRESINSDDNLIINEVDKYINYLNELKTIPILMEITGLVKKVTFGETCYKFIEQGEEVLKNVYWHLFMLFLWLGFFFVFLWSFFLSVYRLVRYLWYKIGINKIFKKRVDKEKIVDAFTLNSLSIPFREKGKKSYEVEIVIAVVVGVLLFTFIGISLKKTPQGDIYLTEDTQGYSLDEKEHFLGAFIE